MSSPLPADPIATFLKKVSVTAWWGYDTIIHTRQPDVIRSHRAAHLINTKISASNPIISIRTGLPGISRQLFKLLPDYSAYTPTGRVEYLVTNTFS
jgi:hypothetical protein